MKKIKSLMIVLSIMCCIFGIISCNEQAKLQPVTLEIPTGLRVENQVVMWDKVENATQYELSINDNITKLNTTSLDISQNIGILEIKVKSIGNGSEYLDSDYCYPIMITISEKLSQPANLALNDNVVSWDKVENAHKYVLIINDKKIEIESSINSYTILDIEGDLTISLQAVGQGNISSSDKVTINGRICPVLDAPTKLVFADNVLSWENVEFATNYEVYVDGEKHTEVNTNAFTLTDDLLNKGCSIKIVAKGDGYKNSAFSKEITLGNGSEFSPLVINSINDFNAIVSNKHYILNSDLVLHDDYIPLNLNNGSIDFNNKTVSGKNSLFNNLSNYTIKNLNFTNNINITSNDYKINAGGICNSCTDCDFVDITGNVTIKITSTNGIASVGGLVGMVYSGNISSVNIQVDITAQNCIVGGIVGKVSDGKTIINDCVVKGKIANQGALEGYSGGAIGCSLSNECECNNIESQVNVCGGAVCGGLVGYIGLGKIYNCNVTGNVQANGKDSLYITIGGFVGHVEGYNVRIQSCSCDNKLSTINSEGVKVRQGGFVGLTVSGNYGGDIFSDCVYKKINNLDRVGEGRGDGITEL